MIVKYNFVVVGKNFVMVWGQAPGGYLGPLSEGAVCPMGRLGECVEIEVGAWTLRDKAPLCRGSWRNVSCD